MAETPSDECHWTLLMISQHWFRLVAWSSVGRDLCRYMASLGHNELTSTLLLWLCHLIQSQFLLPQTPLGPMSQSLPVLSEFVGKYHTIRHIEINVCTISEDDFFVNAAGVNKRNKKGSYICICSRRWRWSLEPVTMKDISIAYGKTAVTPVR